MLHTACVLSIEHVLIDPHPFLVTFINDQFILGKFKEESKEEKGWIYQRSGIVTHPSYTTYYYASKCVLTFRFSETD